MIPFREVPLTFVDSWDDVQDLLSWLGEGRDVLGIDVETSGMNLGRDRIRLGQVGDVDRGWAIPIDGYGYGALFKDVVERYDGTKAFHNCIFDTSFLRRDGVELDFRTTDDTMVMAHLLESGYRIGLKPQAKRFVGPEATAGEVALREGMKAYGWGWDTVPLDFGPYWQYSALDPVLTARIWRKHWPKVLEAGQGENYERELAAIDVLADAQVTGTHVDVDLSRSESARLEAEMAQWREYCPEQPSSDQKLVAHYQKVGAHLTKKTESGKQFSMDKYVLADLVQQGHQDAQAVLEWRKRENMKQYFDSLLSLETDGAVHPSIRVLGAEKTGRMSISAPALQTIPKSKVGRSPFVAREGHTLIMADYNGMEMRMLAHLSRDAQLMRNFHEGLDQHDWLAEQVYGEVTPATRKVAKTAGFAKIYGAGIPKFALTAGIGIEEAEAFIAKYDALHPGVAAFQKACIDQVNASAGSRKWGEVYTWTGRRLMVQAEKAYKAVNYADQGGCAEVTKDAVARLGAAGLGQYVRIPIHDEVVGEGPDEDVVEIAREIQRVMEDRTTFAVPFTVDLEMAKCWGDVYDE